MKKWSVDDVMTTPVVTVTTDTPYRSVVDTLIEHRFSAVPVVDDFRRVTGIVSEADLLCKIEFAGDSSPRIFEGRRRRAERSKANARTAGELMSAPAVVVLRSMSIAAAAKLMDREHVKRLPVVDGLGRIAGIVTRSDLLRVHRRPDADILADVRDGILHVFLIEDSETVHADVKDGVVTLTGKAVRWSAVDIADHLIHQVAGVVEVVDQLTFDFDDRDIVRPAMPFGVA